LENNGRLHLVRISYSHSLGGGTNSTVHRRHTDKSRQLANIYE